MHVNKRWEKDGFLLRSANKEDAELYYSQIFDPLDKEAARLTGSRETFPKEEVLSFFYQSLESKDHCLFLIFAPDGRIIGESVINEIDAALRRANFRSRFIPPPCVARELGHGRWKPRGFCF